MGIPTGATLSRGIISGWAGRADHKDNGLRVREGEASRTTGLANHPQCSIRCRKLSGLISVQTSLIYWARSQLEFDVVN